MTGKICPTTDDCAADRARYRVLRLYQKSPIRGRSNKRAGHSREIAWKVGPCLVLVLVRIWKGQGWAEGITGELGGEAGTGVTRTHRSAAI